MVKTYLTPEDHINQTCDWVAAQRDTCVDYVGQIVRHHRLFLPGDIVFIHANNGQGSRFPVFSISSKGYRVDYYYTKFRSFWQPNDSTPTRNRVFDIVELPACFTISNTNDRLNLESLNSPDFRQWLILLVRAGRARHSATGVSANSPRPPKV